MRASAALLCVLAMIFGATAVEAAGRVALVMGIGDYAGTAKLANPVGDAKAVAEALQNLGFEVILSTDANGRRAIAAIDDFADRSTGADVALFYFAGHGIQIGGQNSWSIR